MRYLLIIMITALPLFAVDYYDTDGSTLLTQEQVDALVNPTWKMKNGRVVLRTAAEEAASVPTLAENKSKRKSAVKAKTATLLNGGYSYDHDSDAGTADIVFASDAKSRERFQETYDAAKDGLISFPVDLPTKDDDTFSVADQAAFDTLRNAARAWALTIVAGEATLLKSIKDAADQAALDAVVDNR